MYVPEEITILALALRLINFCICQMCDYTLEDSKRKMKKKHTLRIAKQYKPEKHNCISFAKFILIFGKTNTVMLSLKIK